MNNQKAHFAQLRNDAKAVKSMDRYMAQFYRKRKKKVVVSPPPEIEAETESQL